MSGGARSGARETVIALLVQGYRVRDAATQAHVDEATIRRWRNQPTFAKRLTDARSEALDAAIARLTEYSVSAATKLLQLTANGATDGVQLRSAIAVLEVGSKLRQEGDLADRVDRLEEAVELHAELRGKR